MSDNAMGSQGDEGDAGENTTPGGYNAQNNDWTKTINPGLYGSDDRYYADTSGFTERSRIPDRQILVEEFSKRTETIRESIVGAVQRCAAASFTNRARPEGETGFGIRPGNRETLGTVTQEERILLDLALEILPNIPRELLPLIERPQTIPPMEDVTYIKNIAGIVALIKGQRLKIIEEQQGYKIYPWGGEQGTEVGPTCPSLLFTNTLRYEELWEHGKYPLSVRGDNVYNGSFAKLDSEGAWYISVDKIPELHVKPDEVKG